MHAGIARAFPTDPAIPSVPPTAPTVEPDAADLRNQLRLQSDFLAPPPEGGWVFQPRVGLAELFTDNVFQTSTDRRYDFVTLLSPGITILGNTPRAQVTFDYQPLLSVYARTPSQTGVSQQLLATGLFTVVPEEIFVDARAVSGVVAANGGFGAYGGYGGGYGGVNSIATAPLGPGGLGGAGAGVGLSKQNQTQFSSFSISPYWLHNFSDIGSARIGYQVQRGQLFQHRHLPAAVLPDW